jgi:PKD repeat protein
MKYLLCILLLSMFLFICCNDSPIASFTISNEVAYAGQKITFDATRSSDSDGIIVEYKWEMGDGSILYGQNVIHKYEFSGNFTIKLQVKDNFGATNNISKSLNIKKDFQLSLEKIDGVIGGTPKGTIVFRSNLNDIPFDTIRSIKVHDNDSSGGAGGKFTGFDLDAINISPIQCTKAADVQAFVPSSSLFYTNSFLIFTPGVIDGSDTTLFGAFPNNNGIDNGIATLGHFDANATTSANAYGFLSLGRGGEISVNCSCPISANNQYLYIGTVSPEGSEGIAQVYVSYTPELSQNLNNSIITVSLPPFFLFIPPHAIPSNTNITLHNTSSADQISVSIEPALTYQNNLTGLLFYKSESIQEGEGSFIWKDNSGKEYVLPSNSIAGVLCAADIYHHSEYKYIPKRMTYLLESDGNPIPVWEIDVNNCESMDFPMFGYFMNHYIDQILKGNRSDTIGFTKIDFQFKPEQVIILDGSIQGKALFEVQPHTPKLIQSVFIPSRNCINNTHGCSEIEKNLIYQNILAHELHHVKITFDWAKGIESTGVEGARLDTSVLKDPIDYPSTGYSDSDLKYWMYRFWFEHIVYGMYLKKLNDDFDKSVEGKGDYSQISCNCYFGKPGRDPDNPDINCKAEVTPAPGTTPAPERTPQKIEYHCPCNSIYYNNLTDCINNCHVSLGCFVGICEPKYYY